MIASANAMIATVIIIVRNANRNLGAVTAWPQI
jgi:hypothetical protein